ncbi:MAG: 1,2-phenylacetyl-CoA epoxidase subunit PaaC [Pseudomonadota bacterium]
MGHPKTKSDLHHFVTRMGDNALILGQRVSAWCGHAPVLEEDIALANMALDLIGQATLWLGYAAEIEGEGRTADDYAFLRDERQFYNCLLVETPNGNFGDTLMRHFLFDSWHYFMLKGLESSTDLRVAEIAQKASKEARYHIERSTDLVIRLGDGTPESHAKMQAALDRLWPFTGELITADDIDNAMAETGIAPDLKEVAGQFSDHVKRVLPEAKLMLPEGVYMRTGGKTGVHSEAMGYLLAEMQSVARAHPGATW